eukprot:16441118-Heterocapsa_arctica.AAC.1
MPCLDALRVDVPGTRRCVLRHWPGSPPSASRPAVRESLYPSGAHAAGLELMVLATAREGLVDGP